MRTSKNMIKDLDRLKKRSDFLFIRNKGQSWVSKSLVLQVYDKNSSGHCEADNSNDTAAPIGCQTFCGRRFGVTVTKKQYTQAVKRNRIKRRLRALACDVFPQYGKDGVDYILIGRKQSLDTPYDDMRRDLIWCLKKLDMYVG